MLLPVRPSPVSLRAVQVDHPNQGRGYVNERLDPHKLTIELMVTDAFFTYPLHFCDVPQLGRSC